MTAVLGPCPCRGCGALVWWNGYFWEERIVTPVNGSARHTCVPVGCVYCNSPEQEGPCLALRGLPCMAVAS